METGYVPVMRLAVEDPEWLPLVKAAEVVTDIMRFFRWTLV